MTVLAKQLGLHVQTVMRHKKNHLADKVSQALEIHQKVSDYLEVKQTSSAIDGLIQDAHQDRQKALERGDYRLAMKAIDTLLKAHELHARLVDQAAQHRTSDVANHPAWHEVSYEIMSVLANHPEAKAAVLVAIRKVLGKHVAITVPSLPGG